MDDTARRFRSMKCPMKILSVLLVLAMTCEAAADDRREISTTFAEQLFTNKIKPLFDRKCIACHGADKQDLKGGFDLSSRDGLTRGGDSGEKSIDLKHPESSLLLSAVSWKDGWEMPPKENDRLTAEQIGWIRQWITAGAPWPANDDAVVSTADPSWSEPNSDGQIRIRTSGGTSDDWTNRRYAPADLWAYQPLQSVHVPPSNGASEFDHPIDAFINRKLTTVELVAADQAETRTLVRRLSYSLTGLPPSAHTDSDELGTEAELDHYIDRLLESPHCGERMAQHWLDVVRYADSNGFSRDDFRPDAHRYRTYVIEAFNDDKPFDQFVREQIAGDTTANVGQDAVSFLWMGPWEQTAMSVAAVTRQLWLDDVTNSIGVTFLAQQLRCASCHDHKFDPIPTRDYYRLQAVFAETKHHIKEGRFEIKPQRPAETHILTGGSLESPAETVEPGVLSVLSTTADHNATWDEHDHNRAALADWIAADHNPLTARVYVNRVWQMHFGRGLVATPNDFGKMGARPTHPELLDWLAGWFIENGWSTKRLHRLILTSDVYRRSSSHPRMDQVEQTDPSNKLLSYFPSRRLTAEEIRDSMLAVSGELNPAVGGPSVYPEINWEVAFQPRLLMGKIAPPYEPSPKKADRDRRSIYAVRIRNLGHPLMEVLNRPGSEMSCERRDETTVTPQAFTMLHGEFVHERALALAKRIHNETEDTSNMIDRAYQSVYGRRPTEKETGLARKHLQKMKQLHEQHPVIAKPLPQTLTLANVAERTGEPQTKTFQLKKLAKYEEDLKAWDANTTERALADLCLVLFNSSEFLYVY